MAAVLLFTLVTGVTLGARAQADTLRPANGEHLVTVHENGHERSFLTSAATLRDALKNAKIRVDQNDLVEPGLDSELIASNYEVNIYRARPLTVVDGNTRIRVMSPYRTAKQIVRHAGMELRDEDIATMASATSLITDGSGVELTIDRATEFTLKLYGKKVTAYTQATTVGGMLKEKGITLEKADTLSLPEDTPITEGMKVEIWRNGKQTFTQEEEIKFPTRQIKDADRPVGYKKVKTPGKNGKKTVTYEIVMKNGKEVSRKEIQSVVLEKAEEQVEVVGTKVDLPPGSHTDWMAAAGISSSDYGYVEFIVSKEGGWCPVRWQGDPGCVNHGSVPEGMVGYGIVQATPGSKMASAGSDWMTNPITQLRWANGYAVGRYGSWKAAYDFWTQNRHW